MSIVTDSPPVHHHHRYRYRYRLTAYRCCQSCNLRPLLASQETARHARERDAYAYASDRSLLSSCPCPCDGGLRVILTSYLKQNDSPNKSHTQTHDETVAPPKPPLLGDALPCGTVGVGFVAWTGAAEEPSGQHRGQPLEDQTRPMPRALDRRSLVGLKPLTPRSAQTVCRSLNLYTAHPPPLPASEAQDSAAEAPTPNKPRRSADAAEGLEGEADERSPPPFSPRLAAAVQGATRAPRRLKRPLTSSQLLMAAHQQRAIDSVAAPRFWMPVRSKRYDAKRHLQKGSATEIKASAARREHGRLALSMSGFRPAEHPGKALEATGPATTADPRPSRAQPPLAWHSAELPPGTRLATPRAHSDHPQSSSGDGREDPDPPLRTWSTSSWRALRSGGGSGPDATAPRPATTPRSATTPRYASTPRVVPSQTPAPRLTSRTSVLTPRGAWTPRNIYGSHEPPPSFREWERAAAGMAGPARAYPGTSSTGHRLDGARLLGAWRVQFGNAAREQHAQHLRMQSASRRQAFAAATVAYL